MTKPNGFWNAAGPTAEPEDPRLGANATTRKKPARSAVSEALAADSAPVKAADLTDSELLAKADKAKATTKRIRDGYKAEQKAKTEAPAKKTRRPRCSTCDQFVDGVCANDRRAKRNLPHINVSAASGSCGVYQRREAAPTAAARRKADIKAMIADDEAQVVMDKTRALVEKISEIPVGPDLMPNVSRSPKKQDAFYAITATDDNLTATLIGGTKVNISEGAQSFSIRGDGFRFDCEDDEAVARLKDVSVKFHGGAPAVTVTDRETDRNVLVSFGEGGIEIRIAGGPVLKEARLAGDDALIIAVTHETKGR